GLRDRRLAGLDRVQDRGRAELVARGGPGLRAATGLRQRLVGLGPECAPEVVPERGVSRFLVGMEPRRPGPARPPHDRGPGLPGVAGQLLARQLSGFPARVERMLEHVPALTSCIDTCHHVHLGSSRRATPPDDRTTGPRRGRPSSRPRLYSPASRYSYWSAER